MTKVVISDMTLFKPDFPGVLVSRERLLDRCGTCGDNLSLLVYVDPASGKLDRIGVCERCRIIHGTLNNPR